MILPGLTRAEAFIPYGVPTKFLGLSQDVTTLLGEIYIQRPILLSLTRLPVLDYHTLNEGFDASHGPYEDGSQPVGNCGSFGVIQRRGGPSFISSSDSWAFLDVGSHIRGVYIWGTKITIWDIIETLF